MKERQSKSEKKAANIRKIYATLVDQYEAEKALVSGKDLRGKDKLPAVKGIPTTDPAPQPSA
jgi:hypothetical protein